MVVTGKKVLSRLWVGGEVMKKSHWCWLGRVFELIGIVMKHFECAPNDEPIGLKLGRARMEHQLLNGLVFLSRRRT